ncbi:MAG: ABC transporter permease [Chloroflexota bacterium]|nr:ABC transporter permease [Chloroflexota bacterium]
MSTNVTPAAKAPAKAPPTAIEQAALRKLPAGWRVIAAKEFADHVVSVRFVIVLLVLGLAAAIPLYFAADQIRNAAQTATNVPAVFLYLFTIPPENLDILRVDRFVGIVAPLLGLAFAFDAVNSERAEGTLPRLLSQPIYRDDVINGKFVAGLGVIGIVLVSVVLLIAGFGMFRLGIVPHGPEVPRLIAWVAVTFLYVALWLSFGLLLSVAIHRAATAALVGFGVWLLLTIFGPLIVALVSGLFTPAASATVDQQLGSIQTQEWVARILPGTLYEEVTRVILHPNLSQVSTPATIGQFIQGQSQIPPEINPGVFSLDQSLLLVWPQLVVLVALTVACFAAAYVLFMRQEVRA